MWNAGRVVNARLHAARRKLGAVPGFGQLVVRRTGNDAGMDVADRVVVDGSTEGARGKNIDVDGVDVVGVDGHGAEFVGRPMEGIDIQIGDVKAGAGAVQAAVRGAMRRPALTSLSSQLARARPFDPVTLGGVADADDAGNRLTERELAVVALLAEGYSRRAIAAELTVSEETVKSHLSRIYQKLGVRHGVEAVAVAIRRKLLR